MLLQLVAVEVQEPFVSWFGKFGVWPLASLGISAYSDRAVLDTAPLLDTVNNSTFKSRPFD